MRPTVLFPILGVFAWLATGFLTYGAPIFWVWLIESVGIFVMGRLALAGIR
jgi:hypothetical protein